MAQIQSGVTTDLLTVDVTSKAARVTLYDITGTALGTIPISGTITANIGTTGGLALDTTLAKLTVSQSTALGSNTQALIGGSVTTAAPTYTTGNINPISLTTAGAIRIDGSGTTQPVSGTITANAGSGTFAISGSVSQSGTWTVQPGNTANTTPWLTTISQGGNSATVTGSNALKVDGSAVTQPVSGTITANIGTSGSLALDATLTGGTQTSRVTDGTNTATVKAASTAAVATDKALVVAISPNNTIPISGTVTSNIGTTNGLSLDATLTKLTISQSTALGSNTQVLIGGSVTTAAPTYTTGNINPISLTTAGAVRIDGSGTTQPISGTVTANAGSGTFAVSGTVTANIGTSGSLALDASVTGLQVSQGSTTSGQKGSLIQGAVTTAAPSYTTAQTSPLSLTTSGLLRIDGSGVTQPVSGTVTANAGSGTFAISGAVSQSGTWTVQPGNTANTTPWLTTISQGGNAATVTGSNALKIDGSAVTQPVSGTITANIGTSGSLALDATLAKLTISQSTALGTNTQALIGGSVTTAAPTYTTGNINPISLTTAGAVRTDSSGTTQPVSGTVTANAGSGTFAVSGTVTANIGTSGSLALDATLTGGTATTRITDGTNTATVKAASTPAVAADKGLVVSLNPGSAQSKSSSATVAQVASSASSVTLLAANANRLGATIVNDSNQILFVKFGTTAASNSYTVVVPISRGLFEVPFGYTGIITGIWAAANGNAYITEMVP